MQDRFPIVRKIHVPIYEVSVFVIVGLNIEKERCRNKWVREFGAYESTGRAIAMCSRGENSFALFFTPKSLISAVVAHEVFHLTHRIMERCGEPFDSSKHEQGAALHEWLFSRVNGILNSPKLLKIWLKRH